MTEKKTWKNHIPLIVTIFIIMSLVGAYFIFPGYASFIDEAYDVFSSGSRQRITDWIRGHGYWGPVIIILGMVAQMFLVVINVVLLMLVAILVYGPVAGSLIAIGGIVLASTVGFIIGRMLGESAVIKLIGKKNSRKMEDKVNEYGYWAVILARVSPWLSNDAISFVAGILRMNYFKFMGATLLGIIPLTVLIAWLGEDWERLKSGLIWITVISAVVFVAYLIYDHRKK